MEFFRETSSLVSPSWKIYIYITSLRVIENRNTEFNALNAKIIISLVVPKRIVLILLVGIFNSIECNCATYVREKHVASLFFRIFFSNTFANLVYRNFSRNPSLAKGCSALYDKWKFFRNFIITVLFSEKEAMDYFSRSTRVLVIGIGILFFD